jgi:integrase
MARSVRSPLETRSARLRLPAGKEHWQPLQPGIAAGYYRPEGGASGAWWGRARCGGRYTIRSLAAADDHVAADGERVLSWPQAQARVRTWAAQQTGTGPLTVAEVCRDYVADLRARRGDAAALGAERRLRRHLLPGWGDRLAAELTTEDFTAVRNRMVPAGADEERLRRGRDSANRALKIIKAAFNHGFRTGRLTDDRGWRKVGMFKNAGTARKVFLAPEQIQRLVNACPPGLRELVVVGAQTGCRLGELTAARVGDFDPAEGTLQVCGKTGERTLYLAPQTILLLRQVSSGRRPDALLLPPSDRAAWTHNLLGRRFAAAVKRAGLDPDVTFYSLRHAFISRSLKQLVPVRAVAEGCGTSMLMVERHYGRFVVADKRRYAEIAAVDLRLDGAGAEVVRLRGVAR